VTVKFGGVELRGFAPGSFIKVEREVEDTLRAGLAPIGGKYEGSIQLTIVRFPAGHLADGRPAEDEQELPRGVLPGITFHARLPGAIHRIELTGKVDL
jgi:hypothetical protein